MLKYSLRIFFRFVSISSLVYFKFVVPFHAKGMLHKIPLSYLNEQAFPTRLGVLDQGYLGDKKCHTENLSYPLEHALFNSSICKRRNSLISKILQFKLESPIEKLFQRFT